MAYKKKSNENVVKFAEAAVTSYPHNTNRVLVIDWASLSYHQMYSMKTAKSKKALGVMPEGDELLRWRNLMFGRVLRYVKLFNPRHIIFALEGRDGWRKKVVKDYYSENTVVYYDSKSYYVVSDNYAYIVSVLHRNEETGEETYNVVKVPMDKYDMFTSLKHKKLGELPERVQKKLWNIYTERGVPIIPSYKGTRKHSEWPFSVDKHEWMAYKDVYATELAPLFRARAVKCNVAEGDDVIYASVKEYAKTSNEIIILTRDSDMSQIDHPKVKIFNHITDTFIRCAYPQQYLAAKVLAGDSSDNINGIAFVNEKTGEYKASKTRAIGEGTALTLMENCPNIYETAKRNGWANQYMRNRVLIDLSMVPDDIKPIIEGAVRMPEPEISGYEKMDEWGISKGRQQEFNQMRSFGYYVTVPLDVVESNPDVFRQDLVIQEEAKAYTPAPNVIDTSALTGVFAAPSFSSGHLTVNNILHNNVLF